MSFHLEDLKVLKKKNGKNLQKHDTQDTWDYFQTWTVWAVYLQIKALISHQMTHMGKTHETILFTCTFKIFTDVLGLVCSFWET